MNTTVDSISDIKNKIAKLLDTFSKVLKKQGCGPEVLELLHRISFYSEEFFINAVFFLEKYHILSYEKHEIRHMEFVKNLVQFQERLEKGESMLSFDLYEYVTNWYDDYLLNTEKEILEYIKNS